jgi:hypothetical protein
MPSAVFEHLRERRIPRQPELHLAILVQEFDLHVEVMVRACHVVGCNNRESTGHSNFLFCLHKKLLEKNGSSCTM